MFSDAVMLDVRPILSNESSLTGEPDDLKKSRDKDCFLLSSCLITEGEDSKAIAIGVGVRSQWGKIKANLVSESVNTPLQDKVRLKSDTSVVVLVAAVFLGSCISICC